MGSAEFHHVAPDLFVWQTYSPKVKADLFSTAIATERGTFLVDPIPLEDAALAQIEETAPTCGVILTNRNHLRACWELADRLSVPIYGHPDSFPRSKPPNFVPIGESTQIHHVLNVIGIDGAVPGEIVLHYTPKDGALIVGDTLINFEPYGFTFLPHKYCLDEKEMRRSLRKLLTRKAERLFFAHGVPILVEGSARLQQLLGADSKSA